MIFKELMAFCAVAKFNSFSKASEHLGVVQSTVTAQVGRLEYQLGKELFDRSRRPVQLTADGAKLAALAAPLFDDLERLLLRMSGNDLSGRVRIASSAAMTDHVLPDPVKGFLEKYPDRQVQVRTHTTSDIVRLVEAREVDLGIVPERTTTKGLTFQPLFEYRWLLVAPLGHPVLNSGQPSAAEMSRWPIIVRRHSPPINAWSVLEDIFRNHELTYYVALELGQTDSIKRYVSIGTGISLLPEFAFESSDFSQLGVRDMTHLFPKETAGFLSVKPLQPQSIVSDFVNSLKAAVVQQASRPNIIDCQLTE